MGIRKKQSEFVIMIGKLIDFATKNGYELSFGDAYRDPRSHGEQGESKAYGRSVSAHKQRLAIDFNLFRDGIYLNSTKDHEQLGIFWESIGGTWGGRFNDGNHYSIEMNGIK